MNTLAVIQIAPIRTKTGEADNKSSNKIPTDINIPRIANQDTSCFCLKLISNLNSRYPMTIFKNAKRLPCTWANLASKCFPLP